MAILETIAGFFFKFENVQHRVEYCDNGIGRVHIMLNKPTYPAMLMLLLCVVVRPLPCAAQQTQPSPAPGSQPQVAAQEPAAQAAEEAPEPVTMFPHSQTARWWVSGQVNIISQGHPDFRALYSGPHSMQPQGDTATTRVETLYLGYQLGHGTEALLDIESTGGHGLSEGFGLAGFTNLDEVHNAALGQAPYVSRVEIHQTVRLSHQDVESDRGPLSLATKVAARRLEFRVGKMSTVDSFDVNAVGSDSHLQFMNGTIDTNGAYDYAADTRGYTYGVVAEYDAPTWAFRFGEMLMPTVANGIDLQWNLRRARAENYELELHPGLMRTPLRVLKDHTVLRLLAYENHADMGDYQQAVARYLAGIDPRPIIENARQQGRVKYGFGVNLEQELPKGVRAFLRLGWNEGEHESFAYTEVNSTAAVGGDVAGGPWHRKLDKIGAAFVTNGISAAHQAYLRDGGVGFLLGDNPFFPAGVPAGSSALNYGRENIFETYYTAHVWRGIFLAADVQRIWNPGYNRDRGPVLVAGTRLHVDF